MKVFPIVLIGFSLLFISGDKTMAVPLHEQTPRFGAWDYAWMRQVRQGLTDGEEMFAPAYRTLLSAADKTLTVEPYSVTKKEPHLIPEGATKNDYVSMGPYWWPDPDKEDGKPYIRRDGEFNPERDKLDSPRLSGLIRDVRILALAWFFSEKDEYAEKAAVLLKTWFLVPETRMNPHLQYAQGIPGRSTGRFIGIIDALRLADLVEAIALLEMSGALEPSELDGIRDWFEEYFTWLTESWFGKREDRHRNNHSVAYDVQACGIAYFLGKDEYVQNKISELPGRRIDAMIESDGRQPHELIRTRAFGYSVANLRNFFDAGEIGLNVGVNVFEYTNAEGASLRNALDYLIAFIGREQDWTFEQISGWEGAENGLGLLVRRAARIYANTEYQILWETVFQDRLQNHWRLLVSGEHQ